MKNELRKEYLNKRKEILPDYKKELDNAIYHKVINNEFYKNSEIILLFSSAKFEINTIEIAKSVLLNKKTLAYPVCDTKKHTIDFYKVNSLDELYISNYNILEPYPLTKNKITNTENSIVIVPGIIYNKSGYRVGYGKGYYDKFLANYKSKKIGIIYEDFLIDTSFNDEFDQSVDIIITNEREITID